MPTLPPTKITRSILGLVAFIYICLSAWALVVWTFSGQGMEIPGDTYHLTTILAAAGLVLGVLSTISAALCKTGALNKVGNEMLKSSTTIGELHRVDDATRGSIPSIVKHGNPAGFLFQILMPLLAIFTSICFKKTFGTELIELPPQTLVYPHTMLYDPVNIDTGVTGAVWAAAVFYNTTAKIGSGDDLQNSRTYILSNGSDDSGTSALLYVMPWLPLYVITGYGGYSGYNAGNVPALVAEVECHSAPYAEFPGLLMGDIENSNSQIYLGYAPDGTNFTVIMQVVAESRTSWLCSARLGYTLGSFTFNSDRNGNWYINSTDVSMSDAVTEMKFVTPPARWNMMADIISDGLGVAERMSRWKWENGKPETPAHRTMLAASRLDLAVAMLAYSEKRSRMSDTRVTGTVVESAEKIILHASYWLAMTALLLLFQGVISGYWCCRYGDNNVDFGILQVMEWQEVAMLVKQLPTPQNQLTDVAAQPSAPAASYRPGSPIQDSAPTTATTVIHPHLTGNCAGREGGDYEDDTKIALRTFTSGIEAQTVNHMMLTRFRRLSATRSIEEPKGGPHTRSTQYT